MGIARNRAIDLLRGRQHHARQRERRSLGLPELPDRVWQDDMSDAVALHETVAAALRELTTGQR